MHQANNLKGSRTLSDDKRLYSFTIFSIALQKAYSYFAIILELFTMYIQILTSNRFFYNIQKYTLQTCRDIVTKLHHYLISIYLLFFFHFIWLSLCLFLLQFADCRYHTEIPVHLFALQTYYCVQLNLESNFQVNRWTLLKSYYI